MSVESLLPRERGEPGGLGDVAVIAFNDVELHVESAQANEANDVVEADRGAAGFPPRDGGLGRAGAIGKLGLREAGPPSCLSNQVSAVHAHDQSITVLLCLLGHRNSQESLSGKFHDWVTSVPSVTPPPDRANARSDFQ